MGPPRQDRETDPRVQSARDLGRYGVTLLEFIDKDYLKQISIWKKKAFAEVVAAYTLAVGMRDSTFENAKLERERDAARDAFIFSLMTAGAMVFLGAWVQYSLVGSAKISRAVLDYSNPNVIQVVGQVTADRFSKMQAAMLGGITKEAGGKLIPLAYPTPKPISYPEGLPAAALAANMTLDFNTLVNETSAAVRDDLLEAQKWMNEGAEFGEAWAAYTGGNIEMARVQIRRHFDKLQEGWANQSEFFGKTPKPIARTLLADQYERALWAAYVLNLFDQQLEKMYFVDPEDRLKSLAFYEDAPGGHRKYVESAIIN